MMPSFRRAMVAILIVPPGKIKHIKTDTTETVQKYITVYSVNQLYSPPSFRVWIIWMIDDRIELFSLATVIPSPFARPRAGSGKLLSTEYWRDRSASWARRSTSSTGCIVVTTILSSSWGRFAPWSSSPDLWRVAHLVQTTAGNY